MRRGASSRPWTTAEVQYLIDSAGRVPRREICKHLRRSAASVRGKAQHLRQQGVAIDLRCFHSRLETCPSCGARRATIDDTGFCEPCRRAKQLADVESRIASLLPQLNINDRATYETTEAELESRAGARPTAPNTAGLSRYRADKANEKYEIALEQWAAGNLRRRIKASQKRKERIEKKVKAM